MLIPTATARPATLPFHEQERGQPCPRGHGCPRSSRATFLVPVHAQERKEASHEPEGRAGVSRTPGGEADGGFAVPVAPQHALGRRDACPTLLSKRAQNPAKNAHDPGTRSAGLRQGAFRQATCFAPDR